MRYRVKTGLVEYCNGHTSYMGVGYLAQRSISLFGYILFWLPVINGEWHKDHERAIQDIHNDVKLRKVISTQRALALAYAQSAAITIIRMLCRLDILFLSIVMGRKHERELERIVRTLDRIRAPPPQQHVFSPSIRLFVEKLVAMSQIYQLIFRYTYAIIVIS